MAKGVAAITMDEEYQQKRREAMNKQPSSFKDGLTRGGKGLVSVRARVTPLFRGMGTESVAGNISVNLLFSFYSLQQHW